MENLAKISRKLAKSSQTFLLYNLNLLVPIWSLL